MNYRAHYKSPIGHMLLTADDEGLTGLWFIGSKYYGKHLEADHKESMVPVLEETKKWLDVYFAGREPDGMPRLHMIGTEFQLAVWKLLLQIPYGQTTSYGAIAKEIASMRGLAKMSAQAVGGAVGRNPIGIIVPCHRVVGSNGSLTGYAGGLDKKIALLRIEGVNTN